MTAASPRSSTPSSRPEAAPYFDIYSDHTYVSGVELQARLAAVRNLLAKYNCVKPIWVTETGCNTTIEKRENETPEAEEVRWRNALRQQAREVVRQMVGLLAEGVEKIFVYQASRVGSRYDYENWGLLDEKGGILPAGAAFNLTVRMLYGKKFQNAFKYGSTPGRSPSPTAARRSSCSGATGMKSSS